MKDPLSVENKVSEDERNQVLVQLEDWLEEPVIVLGFIWLILLLVELVWGLNPLLQTFVYIIWGIFLVEFVVRFALAPHKLTFLRRNWLTVLSLILPALRVVRVARVVQFLSRSARGLRLVKVVGSLNRGMRALRASMRRRGFGYVFLLTIFVALIGSAGIYTFENGGSRESAIGNFGDALWFSSMVITTLGTDYSPLTAEGRVLTFLLALYGFAVFGYLTAAMATFFIGREADSNESEVAGTKSLEALREEIRSLRTDIQVLTENRGGSIGLD